MLMRVGTIIQRNIANDKLKTLKKYTNIDLKMLIIDIETINVNLLQNMDIYTDV